MMHCIIIDDEPLALDLLEDNIRQIPYLKLVAKCRNAIEATQMLQNVHIDLVFTDIQMPGINGLQFVEAIRDKPMFIFITAYEKYALEGYRLDVIDYLLKPVPFDRFLQACNKALDRYTVKHLKQAIQINSTGKAQPDFIFVNVDYSQVKIWLSDIRYIEAQKDYIKLHFTTAEKRPLLIRMSMKGIEELLPQNRFIRIHKSYILNMDEITAIRKNSVFIDDIEFAVSEQYRDAIERITKGGSPV